MLYLELDQTIEDFDSPIAFAGRSNAKSQAQNADLIDLTEFQQLDAAKSPSSRDLWSTFSATSIVGRALKEWVSAPIGFRTSYTDPASTECMNPNRNDLATL